jgi:hypothetical protein
MTLAYTTELTVEQYELLASLLPGEATTGRPRTVNMMLVIQGLLYIEGQWLCLATHAQGRSAVIDRLLLSCRAF